MKKLLALICMITCVFGLTGCGSEETAYTDYEQEKIEYACSLSGDTIIPTLVKFTSDENQESMKRFTIEELAYVIANEYQLNVEGYAFLSAVDSFDKALDEVGEIVSFGEISAEIDDDQIVVHVFVNGTNKNADVELIYSNDMFMLLESAAMNVVTSKGEMMTDAALNTLIGMSTVFIVLILIIIVISGFSLISKVQGSSAKKEKKSSAQTAGIDNAVAQIVGREERVDVGSNPELVAVIAAAIAASEGQTSTDGFVVRSIIRRR